MPQSKRNLHSDRISCEWREWEAVQKLWEVGTQRILGHLSELLHELPLVQQTALIEIIIRINIKINI